MSTCGMKICFLHAHFLAYTENNYGSGGLGVIHVLQVLVVVEAGAVVTVEAAATGISSLICNEIILLLYRSTSDETVAVCLFFSFEC